MSQDQHLLKSRTSYMATLDSRIPQYVVKIELFKADETETEVILRSRAKTQYVIYDETDNVLYKTHQLLYQINTELGERAENI